MLGKTVKRTVFVLTGLLCCGYAQAQNSVNTSGGDAAGSGGTIAYSFRPRQTVYGGLIEYTNDVSQPADYRNVWTQESLKDKKLQDYVIGIRFGYAFGGM